jgi:hypothetical protein
LELKLTAVFSSGPSSASAGFPKSKVVGIVFTKIVGRVGSVECGFWVFASFHGIDGSEVNGVWRRSTAFSISAGIERFLIQIELKLTWRIAKILEANTVFSEMIVSRLIKACNLLSIWNFVA